MRLKITSLESQAFHHTPYLLAGPRGGTVSDALPWLRGRVDGLPTGLDALLVASDLQGVVAGDGGEAELLGVALAAELDRLDEAGSVPPLNRIGVVLAGDLFSAPGADRRGATGDVRAVWTAFAERCRWVAGVAGNHDVFGRSEREAERFRATEGVWLLDGAGADVGGLPIAGVGGVIGAAGKPGRRSAEAFGEALHAALATEPALLVLHESPDAPATGGDGNAAIRAVLEAGGSRSLLVVCGHVHWRAPLAELAGGVQVLNADGRAVLLERAT